MTQPLKVHLDAMTRYAQAMDKLSDGSGRAPAMPAPPATNSSRRTGPSKRRSSSRPSAPPSTTSPVPTRRGNSRKSSERVF